MGVSRTKPLPANVYAGRGVFFVEPMTGIEPAYSAWEADVLPLNYIGGPLNHSIEWLWCRIYSLIAGCRRFIVHIRSLRAASAVRVTDMTVISAIAVIA